MKIAVQLVAYLTFFGFVVLLSAQPKIQLRGAQDAIVSLSFSSSGKRVGECSRLSQEELLKLPPNMRKADECPRERHPLSIELEVDGELAYSDTLPPSGLWQDGKSTVYHRVTVAAGSHRIIVRMNDSGTDRGVDYQLDEQLDMAPGDNLVISFSPDSNAFFLHQVTP